MKLYYNRLEYGGNLEDTDFRKEIEALHSKKVLNALPCKMVGFVNMEAYSGNPYLEIEGGD